MSESVRPQGVIPTGRAHETHSPLEYSVLSTGLQLLIPGYQKVPSFSTPAATQSPFEAIKLLN